MRCAPRRVEVSCFEWRWPRGTLVRGHPCPPLRFWFAPWSLSSHPVSGFTQDPTHPYEGCVRVGDAPRDRRGKCGQGCPRTRLEPTPSEFPAVRTPVFPFRFGLGWRSRLAGSGRAFRHLGTTGVIVGPSLHTHHLHPAGTIALTSTHVTIAQPHRPMPARAPALPGIPHDGPRRPHPLRVAPRGRVETGPDPITPAARISGIGSGRCGRWGRLRPFPGCQ